MRLRSLSLQHFRNIAFAQLDFSGCRQFFVGANGQGKTNLVEAVGLLTALRSFRGVEAGHLVRNGQSEAGLAFTLDHETQGDTQVRLSLRGSGKDLNVDGERIVRLGDFLGRFPAVVFSSLDLQLLRGSPGGRRRWLDLTLSAGSSDYLRCLQTYHKGLAERAALLRRGGAPEEFEAFERIMAPAALSLVRFRRQGLLDLGTVLTGFYAQISDSAEDAAFAYEPEWEGEDEESFLRVLRDGRERDLRFKATLHGPHRDDHAFLLQGQQARQFASEGQQRLLVIALRLAQARWFEARSGIRPVLLADDVVGELDPARRARFWSALDPSAQVLATGTELPLGVDGEWELFRVMDGAFSRF